MFNRKTRFLFAQDPATSWSLTVAAGLRSSDSNTTDGQGRFSFIIGSAEEQVSANFQQAALTSANGGNNRRQALRSTVFLLSTYGAMLIMVCLFVAMARSTFALFRLPVTIICK